MHPLDQPGQLERLLDAGERAADVGRGLQRGRRGRSFAEPRRRRPSWSSASGAMVRAGTTLTLPGAACSPWARGIRASTHATSSATPQAASAAVACCCRTAAAVSEVHAGEGRFGGAQLALERDAGVDGVPVEQIVGVVAEAGPGQVGHAGVEPPRRRDSGAELGEGDLGGGRRRGVRRRRFEGAGAGDERLEIVGGAIAPVADVLAGRGVGALDGPQIEHRRAAAGERVGRGGVGRGSHVEGEVEPHDLPRGGDEGQTEDDEENRPDDACRHPSVLTPVR